MRVVAGSSKRKTQREAEHLQADGRHHRLDGQVHRHLFAHPQHSGSPGQRRRQVLDIQSR